MKIKLKRPKATCYEVETTALIRADEILEGAQDYLRGGCKVRPIRLLIAKRLKALNWPNKD